MAPNTGDALILLVAFVLPGFVTLLIQERTYASSLDRTPLDRLLLILYYSIWSYLLVAAVALMTGLDRPFINKLYEDHKDQPADLIWRGALVVLIPSVLIATTTRFWSGSRAQKKVRGWLRINAQHTEPTGWDYFFKLKKPVYIRATVSNGGRVFGYYGAESFAAYAKDGGDLYLERMYVPTDEDWFGAEPERSQGVWIRGDELVAVEFYDPNYAAKEDPDVEDGDRSEDRGAPAPEG